ncbi:hypothetical protein, partial [Chlorobium phaeovibrioides]|uniref:hypothetical protein n=1 Tax=Chlorobium phaeovibrioides TaxID=1094 RepID=UPI001F3FF1F2
MYCQDAARVEERGQPHAAFKKPFYGDADDFSWPAFYGAVVLACNVAFALRSVMPLYFQDLCHCASILHKMREFQAIFFANWSTDLPQHLLNLGFKL